MSSDRVTILSGRRLVAGGAAADPSQLRVLPVQQLAASLAVVFATALLLSLGPPLLFVHGSALIFPPLAACCGGVWGVVGYRRRNLRHIGNVFAQLPESAIRMAVGEITLVFGMRTTFIAASIAAVIAGAGHGSPATLAVAVSVAPLIYSRRAIDAALAHRGAVRLMREHGKTLLQSGPAAKGQLSVLYVTEEAAGAD
jgi:hypothetical protein